MRKLLVLLPFVACAAAFADEAADFDKTMQDVASDLSSLHWKLQSIYESELPPPRDFSSLAAAKWLAGLKEHGSVTITADSAGIYKGAAITAGVLDSASAGTKYPVLDKVGDWYAIALDEPLKGYSSGWVQAAKAVPYWRIAAAEEPGLVADVAMSPSVTERLYSQIAASVNAVRQKYETNPYVGISGFSVDMTLPPGVSVLFHFK